MFNIDDKPEFTHTVRAQVPTDGGHREVPFEAKFRVLSEDDGEFNISTDNGLDEFLRAAIVSLDDITDAKGNKLPYTAELRDRMLKMPYVQVALYQTYVKAITKARVGN